MAEVAGAAATRIESSTRLVKRRCRTLAIDAHEVDDIISFLR